MVHKSYEPVFVVEHVCGHYASYALVGGTWYRIDDAVTRAVKRAVVFKVQAYMVLFRRVGEIFDAYLA